MMRWLYRILRLFFCPHRWERAGVKKTGYTRKSDGKELEFESIILQCAYCGNMKTALDSGPK